MSITKGMFTSTTDLWETPQAFFDQLNAEFCFSLDACALPWNAKCERYYTPEQDGLSQIWTGVVWCDPPYGRKIGKWVEKAASSVAEGATVVMLLPARTDTQWFHRYIYHQAEIRFVPGRLKFVGAKWNAPFPCIVSGSPKPNIILDETYQLGSWNNDDGWIIDEYLEWTDADVLWWRMLPAPPDCRPPEGEDNGE